MTWTVRDLIEQLGDYDPDTIVLVASDEEGNSLYPLAATSPVIEVQQDGREYYSYESMGMLDDEEEAYDKPDDLERAVILWP